MNQSATTWPAINNSAIWIRNAYFNSNLIDSKWRTSYDISSVAMWVNTECTTCKEHEEELLRIMGAHLEAERDVYDAAFVLRDPQRCTQRILGLQH